MMESSFPYIPSTNGFPSCPVIKHDMFEQFNTLPRKMASSSGCGAILSPLLSTMVSLELPVKIKSPVAGGRIDTTQIARIKYKPSVLVNGYVGRFRIL
jgi:hypothetical protein